MIVESAQYSSISILFISDICYLRILSFPVWVYMMILILSYELMKAKKIEFLIFLILSCGIKTGEYGRIAV